MKVSYDKDTCIHSAKCVNSLPSVFQVKDGNFVIIQDGAPEDKIRETVNALSIKGIEDRRVTYHFFSRDFSDLDLSHICILPLSKNEPTITVTTPTTTNIIPLPTAPNFVIV